MRDAHYDRAKEIFLAVHALDPQERDPIIAGECAGDDDLRAEVESLLQYHDDPPTTPLPPIKSADEDEPHRPWRIGPYRIIREIGRGGMGVVYLGSREDDRFKRRVAIKVLKRGMDTEDILRRFENERQVLAALNHPAIARLYDAGETDDGLPYFAMEFVEGQPIDDYCDTHRLNIAERVKLFREVCAAVHHVHQNLMVHRDLKPSNILITGEGAIKLLDFGIAKLTNPDLSVYSGDPTAADERIMTPAYASPEQVRGDPIGVASDIYSLGVILYELLTGHRPYHIRSRVREEIMRVICEVDPDWPSTAATKIEVIEADEPDSGKSTTISPEGVAKVREGRPERLRRRLVGDLDNIVLMAMRKEPQRRYKSADQFAEDLSRHLEGLPVVARPDTWIYRASKFMRRHRRGVAAAAVFVLALIGWGGTAAYLWIAQVKHSAIVEMQRDRTRTVLDKYFDLTGAFDKFQARTASVDGTLQYRATLAEAAQRSLEGLQPELTDDPRLRRGLAATYVGVGDIWGGHRGEAFGDTTVALNNYRTALKVRSELLAQDKTDPELPYEVAVCHLRIGDVLRFTGDVNGALEHYQQYLELVDSLPKEHPKYNRRLAFALGVVGTTLKDKGRLEEALDKYERSLSVRREELDLHQNEAQAVRDVGVGLVHVGEVLAVLGDRAGALDTYFESIKVRERSVRIDPNSDKDKRYLALSHYFAAGMLLKMNRPSEAAPHVEAAVRTFEQRAASNCDSARAKQDLALGREIQGRLQAALGDHQSALASYEQWRALAIELGDLNPKQTYHQQMLAESHECIGDVHREQDDLIPAIWSYQQALEIVMPLAKADPADMDLQIQLARIMSSLGGALIESGQLSEARTRLVDASSILESVLVQAPRHARAKEGLALTSQRLARLDSRNAVLGTD